MTPPIPVALVIRLPVLPLQQLSLNAYLRFEHWDRAKWKGQQKEDWMWHLKEAGVQHEPPIAEYPVAVTITVRGTGRRTDPSNWTCHYGIKVLLDCLTEPKGNKEYGLGLLKDDSARYIAAFHVNWEPEGEPGTDIRIAPCPSKGEA